MSTAATWLLILVVVEAAIIVGIGRYARAMKRIAAQAEGRADVLERFNEDVGLGLTDPRYRRKRLIVEHDDSIHLATRYGRKAR